MQHCLASFSNRSYALPPSIDDEEHPDPWGPRHSGPEYVHRDDDEAAYALTRASDSCTLHGPSVRTAGRRTGSVGSLAARPVSTALAVIVAPDCWLSFGGLGVVGRGGG